MSKPEISKDEAIRLITPAVDNEISEDDRIAFFKFIEEDEDVRLEFESVRRIKRLLSEQYNPSIAPDSLRKRIDEFLSSPQSYLEQQQDPIDYGTRIDSPSSKSKSKTDNGQEDDKFTNKKGARIYDFTSTWTKVAAAVLLIISFSFALFFITDDFSSPENELIANHIYNHFTNYEGKWVKPTIQTSSLASAEITLSETFDQYMTIPPIENSNFVGVIYEEFIPGFKTPVLEYHHKNDDQYIYIFAFKLDNLKQQGNLALDDEAVNTCIKPKDYHIRDINGKHIVSWKWDGTWYSAISNHNGNQLASLVKPLNEIVGDTNRENQ